MKRALFIGRWQPIHDGHRWLFNQKLEQDIPILIAVRDTPVSDSNPFSTEQVIENLEKEYTKEVGNGMVKIISIPDIESVNYGRGVGYEVNEFIPPEDIGTISATKIREEMKGLKSQVENIDKIINKLEVKAKKDFEKRNMFNEVGH